MGEDRELAGVLRAIYSRALARVLGFTSSLDQAEDALHDAIERALKTWPHDGRPESPEAWLVAVAKNCHLDRIRHGRRVADHATDVLARLSAASPWTAGVSTQGEGGWDDDLLRLVFAACDPLLDDHEAAALTLSTVIGLSVGEIAAAFLVAPRTMEQRLTRARARLRERRGELEIVPARDAHERLDAALRVTHLVYNEGYWSAAGAPPIRIELCRLGLGLARSLHALLAAEPEAAGLLVLLTLHEARREARLDQHGQPVKLPDQDRSRWDRAAIADCAVLLEATLARGSPGPFQIEAAIAAVHCEAASADLTDWVQIAELYALLEEQRPSPVVRVNRAFAVARAEGPASGLALLDEAETQLGSARYPYAALVRGVLWAELGRLDESEAALLRAAELAGNPHEIAEIERRLATVRAARR